MFVYNPLVTTSSDNDFVYVDPNRRVIIGPVEWLPSGRAKAIPIPTPEENVEEVKPSSAETTGAKKDAKREERRRKPRKKQYYPWCSYRTAKRVYRVEGKEKEAERSRPLEEAMQKAVVEPYWD